MAGPIALVDGKASVPAPGFVTTQTGVYRWVADYGGDSNNTEARSECGNEAVTIGKDPTSIDTVPSNAKGAPVGTALTDSGTVIGNDPTGNLRFYLFGPGNPTCNFEQVSASAPHGWIFMAGPIALVDGKASVPAPGFVTTQTGVYRWVADYGGDSNNTEARSECGNEAVTIGKDPTSIDTVPSNAKGAPVGTALTDSGTVIGNDPTGNLRFYLFGPGNPTCNFEQVSASAPHGWIFMAGPIALVDGKASVPAPGFVTTQTGVYRWVADYGGDSNNTEARSECGNEAVTIGKDPTSIDTVPSNAKGAPVGTALTDSGTVIGNDPTGNLRFYLFGPGNPTCNFEQVSASAPHGWIFMAGPIALVDGKASVPAPGFVTTQTGVYRWVADYGGDSNNTEARSECGNEAVTIGKDPTSIDTVPSNAKGAPVGTALTDSGTVIGNDPTGNLRFYLFGPGNPTCNFEQVSASAPHGWIFMAGPIALVDGKASVPAPGFVTTQTGVYRWVADYGGDSNNTEARSECGKEAVSIGKHSDTLTSTASSGGVIGTVVYDTAKVTGRMNATGTVTFSLYGAGDTTCSGTAIFTSTVALGANGTAKSATFSGTTKAGTYNWIAIYNGDAKNVSSKDTCGDEPVNITKPTGGVQGITTPGTGAAIPFGPAMALLLGGLALILAAAAGIRRERRRR